MQSGMVVQSDLSRGIPLRTLRILGALCDQVFYRKERKAKSGKIK
jgi:hypothetical protein